MACPYFMPVEKLAGTWPHPARLPLGGGWSGHCTAPGHEGGLPSQDVMEAFCNLGYADCCSWAPRERAWDAVRFAVSLPDSAKRPDGMSAADPASHVIRLHFVCERRHRPVEHGDLEFDLEQSAWLRPHRDARIQKMAQCFLESYLSRKA